MKTRTTILFMLAVLLLGTSGQTAEAQQKLRLMAGSQLWIEGTSTLNTFQCRSEAVEGVGLLEPTTGTAQHASATPHTRTARAEVIVAVATFDCGKRRMNRDFYAAMKGKAHPVIRYELKYADVLSRPPQEDGLYRLRVVGRLTIAGTERSITTTLWGRRLADDRYRLEGNHRLLMSTFGIDPPTALMGLVRTHDRILVRFNLVAAAQTTQSTTTHATQ